jgi:squalene-hopene/tetraprenyl-beta-curcumene cyclase
MFSQQNEKGTWDWPDCWPPLEDNSYHGATVAAMAVGTAKRVGIDLNDSAIKTGSERLKKYLGETKPPYDYHRVMLLWAECRWPGLMTTKQKSETIDLIYKRQCPDGGWSLRTLGEWESRRKRLQAETDRNDPPSDGHATGLAITVLREAGVAANDPHIQRGLTWLKKNQRESGRWWTRSLNNDGFSFITYSGTCYPLLALHACGEMDDKSSK